MGTKDINLELQKLLATMRDKASEVEQQICVALGERHLDLIPVGVDLPATDSRASPVEFLYGDMVLGKVVAKAGLATRTIARLIVLVVKLPSNHMPVRAEMVRHSPSESRHSRPEVR
jgi:hypothetical protein